MMRIAAATITSAIVFSTLNACKSLPFGDSDSKESEGEYIPEGWEKVNAGEPGSLNAFLDEIKSLNSDAALELSDDQTATSTPSPAPVAQPFAMAEVQYSDAFKLKTSETLTLTLAAKTAISSNELQKRFTFNKEVAVRVWAYADNARTPLWQQDKDHPSGYISLANRSWATYQCGVVVTLSSEDLSSLQSSGGLNIEGLGIFSFNASAGKDYSKTSTFENVFVRHDKVVLIKSADLPNGSTVGPSSEEIRKACSDFAKDPAIQAAIDTDAAVRAKHWRYENNNTVCIEDKDCENWHKEILGSLQDSTKARCVLTTEGTSKKTFRACRLRSLAGGGCTAKDQPRRPFEYPCDQGLKCKDVTTGSLWWKTPRGECAKY